MSDLNNHYQAILKDLEKLSPAERFAYIQSHSDIKDITNEVR